MGESMSKGKEVVNRERLLLEEIDKYSRIYGECLPADLADTLQEVLSQPEQEQEPMAWMWTRNYEGGGYTNMVFQMRREADEYAKDSESLKRPDLVRPLYLGVDK